MEKIKESKKKNIAKKPRKTLQPADKGKRKTEIKKKPSTAFKFFELPRIVWRVLKYVVLFFAAVFIFFFVLLISYSVTSIDNKNTTVLVDIPTGSSFLKVTEILNGVGLVNSRFFFYSLAITKRATRNIRAGEYEFNTSLTPAAVIDKLIRGEIKTYLVTIPEDFSMKEIAARLEYFKLIDDETFFD